MRPLGDRETLKLKIIKCLRHRATDCSRWYRRPEVNRKRPSGLSNSGEIGR